MSQGKGKRGNREVHCRSLRAGRRDIEMAPEDTAIKNDRAAAPSLFWSAALLQVGGSQHRKSLSSTPCRVLLPSAHSTCMALAPAPPLSPPVGRSVVLNLLKADDLSPLLCLCVWTLTHRPVR
ncbi:unnamed protein product [Gadus morhua 'NCC']